MRTRLEKAWYRDSLNLLTIALLPLAYLFFAITQLRRLFYRLKLLKTQQHSVPIIVVGNISVGGTGKTPFVIYLAQLLQTKGYRVGIVSRGVGARSQKSRQARLVQSYDRAAEVGDEALLLVQRTQCPLAIAIDRNAAVRLLLEKTQCDVIISDDGLQRYSMGRDIEIVLVDAARQFGNRQLLPAGPLRESIKRLKTVDMVITNGSPQMQLQYDLLVNLKNRSLRKQFNEFKDDKIAAYAAIGNPERFFKLLEKENLTITRHIFQDHHLYSPADFRAEKDSIIVMTEKDAVKCRAFADERMWYLPIDAKIAESCEKDLLKLMEQCYAAKKISDGDARSDDDHSGDINLRAS